MIVAALVCAMASCPLLPEFVLPKNPASADGSWASFKACETYLNRWQGFNRAALQTLPPGVTVKCVTKLG